MLTRSGATHPTIHNDGDQELSVWAAGGAINNIPVLKPISREISVMNALQNKADCRQCVTIVEHQHAETISTLSQLLKVHQIRPLLLIYGFRLVQT